MPGRTLKRSVRKAENSRNPGQAGGRRQAKWRFASAALPKSGTGEKAANSAAERSFRQ